MDAKLIEKLVSEEIKNGYTFSRQGIVTSRGKFEGESIATLYYYDCYLNGGDTVMMVTAEEKQAFDIEFPYIYLGETNEGFVYLVGFESRELAEDYQQEV